MTEDEMAGWHHRLNGYRFGWTLGVGDGQGGLACFGSWGHKESDTTERLNRLTKSSKMLLRVSLEVEPGPCLTMWFPGCPSLVFASLTCSQIVL